MTVLIATRIPSAAETQLRVVIFWKRRLVMHSLALIIVPYDSAQANVRPLVARDAALSARIETLLFLYEQPQEELWGVDHSRGFQFDWCVLGGRWAGWGRQMRQMMIKQRLDPSRRPIPHFLERNSVWSEDLTRVRIASFREPLRCHYSTWRMGGLPECPADLRQANCPSA